MNDVKVPFEPLEEVMKCRGIVGITQIAAQFGWTLGGRQRILNLRNKGVTLRQADALACQLGLNPIEVWPQWADLYKEQLDSKLQKPARSDPRLSEQVANRLASGAASLRQLATELRQYANRVNSSLTHLTSIKAVRRSAEGLWEVPQFVLDGRVSITDWLTVSQNTANASDQEFDAAIEELAPSVGAEAVAFRESVQTRKTRPRGEGQLGAITDFVHARTEPFSALELSQQLGCQCTQVSAALSSLVRSNVLRRERIRNYKGGKTCNVYTPTHSAAPATTVDDLQIRLARWLSTELGNAYTAQECAQALGEDATARISQMLGKLQASGKAYKIKERGKAKYGIGSAPLDMEMRSLSYRWSKEIISHLCFTNVCGDAQTATEIASAVGAPTPCAITFALQKLAADGLVSDLKVDKRTVWSAESVRS